MQTVNIQDAKAHLSRLVDQAAKGKPFMISKEGKPLVKVIPVNDPEAAPKKRLGFMAGRIRIPDDFDRMGSAEIERLFDGAS